jgi:conjugal transfer pilus assembly protein TraV
MRSVCLIASVLALALGGCAGSLTGMDGESKFSCKAPDGVTCSSLSGVYANAVANNLPGLRKDGKGDPAVRPPAKESPDGTITGQVASSGDPLRTQARVLRIWIAPWEDTEGDLHDQSYIYVVANAGRWTIEHSQRHIVDRYRPTFIKAAPGGQALQKPLTPSQKPSRPLGGPSLPGNQAIGPGGTGGTGTPAEDRE